MGNRIGYANSQRGATAVLAAICIVVLVGILGLVVDLGIVYARKTELQNAADAAALAGARELDGTNPGVAAARDQAIALAALNGSDFAATPTVITEEQIKFAPSPTGPWTDVAAALAAPGDKWFVKVDTAGLAQGTRPTWFIRVLDDALASTTTSGLAVAGRTLCEGLPIFFCARPGEVCNPGDGSTCGFEPGTTYRLVARKGDPKKDGEPYVGPGNIGWLDPVPPGSKGVINGVPDMTEILCRGWTRCLTAPTTLSSATQDAYGQMPRVLNTRFGEYPGVLRNYMDGPNACAADTNVKKYAFDDNAPGGPRDWMENGPTGGQTETEGGTPGVHWAGVRPPAGTAGALAVEADYPATGTPYSQTSGKYFAAPPGGVTTSPGRRLLTVGIASNCGTINGRGDPVEIVKFAKFFMQREAPESSAGAGFYGEFVEIVPSGPVLRPGIKLYR